MMSYDFGFRHPLKPIRLARTVALLSSICPGLACVDPGLPSRDSLLAVHEEDYVAFVESASGGEPVTREELVVRGMGSVDTPAFAGMYESALAYCGGAVRAAERIVEGDQLAFNISGGLHHAQRGKASGFCIFNDPAISLTVLKSRFDRLLYVDIDLHHGDGVEAIFVDDPDVVTLSIHETGRSLYPGTGFLQDSGAGGAVVNIPLDAGTTGDVWLWSFNEVFARAVDFFKPQAIVLQMGCDAHFADPLGHLRVSVQDWLAAVCLVRDAGLPVLACGGGGYELKNVPRMWAAAVLRLSRLEVPHMAPESIDIEWGVGQIMDPEPLGTGGGREAAAAAVDYWRDKLV